MKGPQAVGQVTAAREVKGERRAETRFLLTGGRPGPERFPATAPPCRAAENPLRRVPGVAMGGDALRNRKGSGPGNPAPVRRPALDLAQLADGGRVTSMRGKLRKAGRDGRFLLKPASSAAGLPENEEPEKIQMR